MTATYAELLTLIFVVGNFKVYTDKRMRTPRHYYIYETLKDDLSNEYLKKYHTITSDCASNDQFLFDLIEAYQVRKENI